MSREYAVYKGDDFICTGTAKECAEFIGVKPETIQFYSNPAYKRRRENRRTYKNVKHISVDRIEEDEFEEESEAK